MESPLKEKSIATDFEKMGGSKVCRQLDLQVAEGSRPLHRKRKSKVPTPANQTPDLNILLDGSNAIVPAGLVNSRVSLLDSSGDGEGGSMIETLKKQKRSTNQIARSAAVVKDSPRRAQ